MLKPGTEAGEIGGPRRAGLTRAEFGAWTGERLESDDPVLICARMDDWCARDQGHAEAIGHRVESGAAGAWAARVPATDPTRGDMNSGGVHPLKRDPELSHDWVI